MKSLFESKTFYFGLAQVIFGAVGYLTGWIDHQAASSLILTGVGTIGFRTQTSQPVTLSL